MDVAERRVVERASTRNGELRLAAVEAGGKRHYELIFNGVYLMASYAAASSEAMVDAVLEGMESRKGMDLLIGGLGMGFSLRRALAHPGLQTVSVVELEPRIVAWNRTYFGNADILDDPRTEVVVADFHDFAQGLARSYHGIMMDIDNGPDWVVRPQNRRSYSLSMLQTLKGRLRSGAALSIWAHARNKSYRRALEEIFSEVWLKDTLDYDLNGKPLKSVLYMARP